MKPITFDEGNVIGLIIRGKVSPNANPFYWLQHVDCILSDGTPVGFFGPEPIPASGGSWGEPSTQVMMNRKGAVMYGYLSYKDNKRSFYVDAKTAKQQQGKNNGGTFSDFTEFQYISTVVLLKVSHEQAKRFDDYWKALRDNPSRYDFVGNNCATRAAQAFEYAGLLPGGIVDGPDAPNNLYKDIVSIIPSRYYSNLNAFYGYLDGIKAVIPQVEVLQHLYKQLKDELPVRKAILSGYVGFQLQNGKYSLTVEPAN